MSNVKVEVIKTEDAEGNQTIALMYEGREVETWLDLLKAMQREYGFDLIISPSDGSVWIEVESKNLKCVHYDKTSAHLLIQFHSGGTYRYEGVSQTTVNELLSADSKNTYFRANIKDQYPCERV